MGVIVGCGILFVMFALCASIAIPNFLTFGQRSKAAEARSNLKAAYTAERSYFAEKDEYSDRIELLYFSPERGNRYLYLVSPRCPLRVQGAAADGGEHCGVFAEEERLSPKPDNGALIAGIPASLMAEAGVRCTLADGGCVVTIIAAGNLDTDSTIDLWSISTEDRVIAGETVSAGWPYNHVNDVEK